jgi:hypothetical protein
MRRIVTGGLIQAAAPIADPADFDGTYLGKYRKNHRRPETYAPMAEQRP